MNKEFVLPPRRRFTSREKRRNAEMVYAQANWRAEAGLRMVHKLKEHDAEMRWLAGLFPLEDGWVSQEVAELRLSEWCEAHPDDARALRYLANAQENISVMEKAASMGDGQAMAAICFLSPSVEKKFQLAHASFEQNDAEGTCCLVRCFRDGLGCEKNESLAQELLVRAAELGSAWAVFDLVETRQMEPAQRVNLLASFFGLYFPGSAGFRSDLDVFHRFNRDGGHGSVLFEVGEMFKGGNGGEMVFLQDEDTGLVDILMRAVAMFDKWCDAAREACVAWVLIAKRMEFNKDVRKMVAKMVWDTRREGKRESV